MELSCGDTEASSHAECKEGRRVEEGGSRRETKPAKLSKLKRSKINPNFGSSNHGKPLSPPITPSYPDQNKELR